MVLLSAPTMRRNSDDRKLLFSHLQQNVRCGTFDFQIFASQQEKQIPQDKFLSKLGKKNLEVIASSAPPDDF